MDVSAHGELWPPRIGDYARVRMSGALGEVVEIADDQGEDVRYAVNLFAQGDDGIVECCLDDLSPVWPTDWTRAAVH